MDRPLPEVIDLTSSSPPTSAPETPRPRRASGNSSDSARRYVVPQWQPDSEATECPICKRPFTWMFRRHHCRKCGRVVCNDCSPHRITIPRQFIVHPPGPDTFTSPSDPVNRRSLTIGSSEDESYDNNLSSHHVGASVQLEGGEKVRLCNPCVPDPQPDPLPNYPPFIPDHPSRGASWEAGGRHGPGMNHAVSSENRPRGFSAGLEYPARNMGAGSNPYLHQYHRSMGAIQPVYPTPDPRGDGSNLFDSYRGQSSPSRYRMLGPPSALNTPLFSGPSLRDQPPHDTRLSYIRPRPSYPESRQPRDEPFGISLPSQRPHPRPLHELTYSPAVHRPRMNENDICPVCRHALPPCGPDGDETAREAHIMECIHARDPSYHADSSNTAAAIRLAGSASEGASSSQHPHHQRLNMLTFTATEKDCVAQEDGQVQECSICMVEYDVGDELVRLECLCKFHRSCIMEWVERKAECPVHKLLG
ncbi:hypothetical protein A1O7_01996 [Cladophialophora yegresii CBS 114405]|uniref:FYVE-type domain-containing protein n=1 Tax=Cladophialophora yegresii CBS 114405 TaxID=1182544 RepID=W9W0U9_9EURO|nr:uncharacterized protein A1O7_01996 [Cladophialophora yegresii CBS 114405]EXJ61568.1 hypothetical protein A1O7_01996 [Cladophialophora yegresii CBS 114405]